MVPTVAEQSINWKFLDSDFAEIIYLYVGYLNGHFEIPVGVMEALMRHNISQQDFPAILEHDPVATETSALHNARFERLNRSYPYVAPPIPTAASAAGGIRDERRFCLFFWIFNGGRA